MARFINPVPEYKANSKLFFFDSGTNNQLETFADELQTISNTHPVLCDAAGNTPNVFYSGSAKLVVLDEFDVQYIERDPVGGEKELGDFSVWNTTVTYDKGDFVEGSDGNFYQSLSNANTGNDPTLTPAEWEQIPFNGVYNPNISYGIGAVTQTANGKVWRSIVASNLNNDPDTDTGENWRIATDELWVNKSAAFNVIAGKKYQIDASSGSVDAPLATSYLIGDVIIVHNESISTNLVRLTNTALTIKGPGGTVTTSDNLTLEAGDTAHLIAKSTTILELV